MEPSQERIFLKLRFYKAWGIGVAIFALLSGAAYSPFPISSTSMQTVSPLFEPLSIAPLEVPMIKEAVFKKHPQKRRLTQRLNDRYRIGRSLRASA